MALPEHLVFTESIHQSRRILACTNEDPQFLGVLRFQEGSVFNPAARFIVEYEGETGWVHIRSYANKKYWVRYHLSYLLGAISPIPRNTGAMNSTLFRVTFRPDNSSRFYHAVHGDVGTTLLAPNSLAVGAPNLYPAGVKLVNPEFLVKLPRFVAFKGTNDRFLGVRGNDGYNEFVYAEDGELQAIHEIVTLWDGGIRVKSLYNNRYWKAFPLIRAIDSEESDFNSTSIFDVMRVDSKTIALRNRYYERLCGPVRDGNNRGRFSAESITAAKVGCLELVEPIFERRINVTEFRTSEAVIYNREDKIMAQKIIENRGSETMKVALTFSETARETNTWKTTNTVTKGVETSINSGIPVLGDDLKVTVSGSYTEKYEWEKTIKTERTIERVTTVRAPPNKRTIIHLRISKAAFEVPYSYTQTVRYKHQENPVDTEEEDGVFTGHNVYVAEVITFEEDLP